MYIFTRNSCNLSKKQRSYFIDLFNWILGLSSVSCAISSARPFIIANKDSIKNITDVVGSIAKAGATPAPLVKPIVDIVKAKRLATDAADSDRKAITTPIEKVFGEKSSF